MSGCLRFVGFCVITVVVLAYAMAPKPRSGLPDTADEPAEAWLPLPAADDLPDVKEPTLAKPSPTSEEHRPEPSADVRAILADPRVVHPSSAKDRGLLVTRLLMLTLGRASDRAEAELGQEILVLKKSIDASYRAQANEYALSLERKREEMIGPGLRREFTRICHELRDHLDPLVLVAFDQELRSPAFKRLIIE